MFIYWITEQSSSWILKNFIYLFLEREEGREKEREKNIDVWEGHLLVASLMPPTGEPAAT